MVETRPWLPSRVSTSVSRAKLSVLRLFYRNLHLPTIMDKINLVSKFSQIHEYWKPYIAGELNGQLVKLDKLKGEFVWHHHENEDEMFLVVKGRFRIEFRDKTVQLEEGEFIVVPRGVEHKPVAEEECWILLFEPASTLNTGNVENEFTLSELEKI
jgi:mannose-6-phosphate isomerase-like protein (cupin superfamily)